jgi:hypothetical protein
MSTLPNGLLDPRSIQVYHHIINYADEILKNIGLSTLEVLILFSVMVY